MKNIQLDGPEMTFLLL